MKRRAFNATSFTAVAAVLIITAYAYLFYLASGTSDLHQLLSWTASYSSDADTRFSVWSNLFYSLRGHVRLFFGGRFNLLTGLINPLVIVLLLALIATLAFLVFNVVRTLATATLIGRVPKLRLETRQKTALLLSLLWVFMYVVFLFFFLPQNTFYRLFYLPALILLLGLLLAARQNKTAHPRTLTAFVILVALANFLFLIYPDSPIRNQSALIRVPYSRHA